MDFPISMSTYISPYMYATFFQKKEKEWVQFLFSLKQDKVGFHAL